MTLIGDKSRFAVQFDPIHNRNHEFPECHFTYWIGDREIGNPAFEATKGDILEEVRDILVDKGKRENERLFALPAMEVINLISEGLCGKTSNHSYNWRAHNLTYFMGHGFPSEEGNRFDVYIVELGGSSRVVVSDSRTGEFVLEKHLHAGEVDDVLLSSWKAMEREC